MKLREREKSSYSLEAIYLLDWLNTLIGTVGGSIGDDPLLMIALGYCIVKVFFGNINRSGILLIQMAVGSLFLLPLPRGCNDGFTRWCKQVIAICLTAFLQTTLLFLRLLTWQSGMLLGVMLAAEEVPRIAQEFGLDTSVKVSMSSVIYHATSAVNLTRSIVVTFK